jgi:hypothetical protein
MGATIPGVTRTKTEAGLPLLMNGEFIQKQPEHGSAEARAWWHWTPVKQLHSGWQKARPLVRIRRGAVR